MADIAAGDLTYTIVKSRKEESGHKVLNLTVAFGDGALTYPSGGIPLTAAKMGCPNQILSVVIDGPASGDGIVYKYDKANNKIRMYKGASHAHDFLVKGGTAAAGTDAINIKSTIIGKESATDATNLAADVATKGGVQLSGQNSLGENSAAPAATTLYIEVKGW
jgi:hypothetical protein